MTLHLSSPSQAVKGIGPAYQAALQRKKISSVFDLLLHFPEEYVNFKASEPQPVPGEFRPYLMTIASPRLSRNFARRLSIVRIPAKVGSSALTLIFFNKPYLREQLPGGATYRVFGKIEEREGKLQMINPQIYPLGQTDIIAIYPALASLKPGTIRRLQAEICQNLADEAEELPEEMVRRHRFTAAAECLRRIHLPSAADLAHVDKLKRRFAYQEFLFFQLELQYVRNFFRQRRRLRTYHFPAQLRQQIADRLPFALSADQVRIFAEIVNDLLAPRPMQRLLQGDVGSGKTILAFLAMLIARANGLQTAFLAPTEVLAGQHFRNAVSFFANEKIALLSGSTAATERKAILQRLADGDIGILFGTHAMLQERVRFAKLALVVIDEQHRFGVAQRAALFFKAQALDLLVTTATPIPRTLLLTLYQDLQVSVLKQGPAGRKPITTRVIRAEQSGKFYGWLRSQLAQGRKAYLIVPLIQPAENSPDLRSLVGETPRWRSLFAGIPWAAISGQSDQAEIDRSLARFRSGKIRLLASTTVVEVGIDIPDATLMIIENADRFGLAQLHQLRGRVGRGPEQSQCFLLSSPQPSETGRQRLEIMTASNDGFYIAESDLRLRGGGAITGLEQSGSFDFRIADSKRDIALLRAARQDAADLLAHPEWRNEAVRAFLRSLPKRIRSLSFS